MARLLLYVIELFLVMLVWRVLARALRSLFGAPQPRSVPRGENPGRAINGQTSRDPVCGMFVSTELSHRLNVGGRTLHFCSEECLGRYQRQESGGR